MDININEQIRIMFTEHQVRAVDKEALIEQLTNLMTGEDQYVTCGKCGKRGTVGNEPKCEHCTPQPEHKEYAMAELCPKCGRRMKTTVKTDVDLKKDLLSDKLEVSPLCDICKPEHKSIEELKEKIVDGFDKEFSRFVSTQLPDNSQKSFAVLHGHLVTWLNHKLETELPHLNSRTEEKTWYFEGDELVIKKGKWVIDRYKRIVRDIEGIIIKEGDTLETCISSEWDSEVPRSETAVVEYDGDVLWAKSEMTSDWYNLYENEHKWKVVKSQNNSRNLLERFIDYLKEFAFTNNEYGFIDKWYKRFLDDFIESENSVHKK